MTGPEPAYTRAAVEAVSQAAREEHDFAGWVAGVLASVAAEVGGTEQLLSGRPGSWKAGLVRALLAGTVGEGDEALAMYAGWGRT